MDLTPPHIPTPWKAPVRKVRFRIQLGWFWSVYVGWLVCAVGIASLLAWLLKGNGQSEALAWLIGGGLMCVGFIQAVNGVVSKKIRTLDSVARLDEGWKLQQSLVRSFLGKGSWPEMPAPPLPCPVRYAPTVWAPPVLICLCFLLLSQWIPHPVPPVRQLSDRSAPVEWTEVETFVDALKEEEVVEPEALSSIENEIDRLRALPEQEWYGPAGQEATDRLRERIKSDAARLTDGMAQTANLLQMATSNVPSLTTPQQNALHQEMQQLLDQLGQTGLPLQADQLDALRQVDLSQLQQISAEQLEVLEQQLREQGEAAEAALLAAGLLGESVGGEFCGTDGGGPADLGLGADESSLSSQVPVLLDLNDPDSVRMGDLMEVREIEHQESVGESSQSAGAIRSGGGSGFATWQRELPPVEQDVLQHFFQSSPSPSPESP